jgi:hypothetical protein
LPVGVPHDKDERHYAGHLKTNALKVQEPREAKHDL